MLHVVSPDNLSTLLPKMGGRTLWVPVLSDSEKHYVLNRISSVYVYSLETEDEFIIGFHSNDLENVKPRDVFDNLPDLSRPIAYKAKYFDHLKCVDADMFIWFDNNHPIMIDDSYKKIFSIYRDWYKDLKNINDVIPIMRIVEYARMIRNQFIRNYIENKDSGYVSYELIHRMALEGIERSGLATNDPGHPIIYSEYNPYTLTGRPSNMWGKIHLNSLNKTDGTREMIISRFENGRLFEFDYDSYHLRLVGHIIGYSLPKENLHEKFAIKYFGRKELTDDLYQKSKQLSFQQLYGEILLEYDIEFFRKVHAYIDVLWIEYEEKGYFSSPVSGRKFYARWFTDMNKAKMFNYIIQCVETEENAKVLGRILHYLYEKKSKLVMYTYDAILVDFSPEDGREVLQGIKSIMGGNVGYPVKVKAGINYHDMIDVTI